MKKIILAAALLAPFAAAAPALAQFEATERNTVTQYQNQSPREFTARRAYQAPASGQTQQAPNNQLQGGNF